MKKIFPYIILIILFVASIPEVRAQQAPISHSMYDALLKKYVFDTGKVNYKGFIKDKAQLEQYLQLLSNNPPQQNWSKDEQLAYWINAYNAFTIQLITQHYPLKSIKDISSTKTPSVNTPWDIKFIHIGKEIYDLNNIEHDILREKFNEPRIHFAIVCASVSCPKLLNEAFTGTKINQQLDAQARSFINDPIRNKISANRIQTSEIFDWFKSDFTKNNSLINFLNKYSKVKINANASVSTLDYNWNLNE